jgi:hypothetical protein
MIDLDRLKDVPRELLEDYVRGNPPSSESVFSCDVDLRAALSPPKLRTRAEAATEALTLLVNSQRVRSYGASNTTGVFDAKFGDPQDSSRFYHLVCEFRDAPPDPAPAAESPLPFGMSRHDAPTESDDWEHINHPAPAEAAPLPTISLLHETLQNAENLAQGWRDHAMASEHMHHATASVYERCAEQLDAVIATAAPDERRAQEQWERHACDGTCDSDCTRASPAPPTELERESGLQQQVNRSFARAEAAETELSRLRTALGEIREARKQFRDDGTMHLVTLLRAIDAALAKAGFGAKGSKP